MLSSFFVQGYYGLRLGTTSRDPVPANNGFLTIQENPVFIFACCVLHQQNIPGCNPEFCTEVHAKVTAFTAALADHKVGDPVEEVHREMKKMKRRHAARARFLEINKVTRHKSHKELKKKLQQLNKKNSNPYTTHLWEEGKIYLEISAPLLAKWVLQEAPAVWLITWMLKTISDYEAKTCLQIWVLPPVITLARFVGVGGFLGLPPSVSVIMHEDESGFTHGLGVDAGAVEWSVTETVTGVQHEFGHIFGMDHLQKRSDRDTYLNFDLAACTAYWTPLCALPNSDPNSARDDDTQTAEDCVSSWVAQYDKDASLSVAVVSSVFDYGSIMAYPYDACIQPIAAQVTAFQASRSPSPPTTPYASGVTALDYEQINLMYNCAADDAARAAVLAIGGAMFDAAQWLRNEVTNIFD